MANALGTIKTLEVRCPCGTSFESADMYLQHKKLCRNHQDDTNVRFISSDINRGTAAASAKTLIRSPPRKPAATRPDKKLGSSPTSPIPSVESTKTKLPCSRGRGSTKEIALNQHLEGSKVHRGDKFRSAPRSTSTTPGPVPSTAPQSHATSTPSSSGSTPGTIPSSALLPAKLLTCDCGQAFETQRILDLHKRDSLYHKRQDNESSARKQQRKDSLLSSFASLSLDAVAKQIRPLTTDSICVCGHTFTNQTDLDQHERDARRLVWQGKKETNANVFKTARPRYSVDDELRNHAVAIALQ